MSLKRTILVIAIVIAVPFTSATAEAIEMSADAGAGGSPAVQADSLDSAGEYLSALQTLNGTEAFRSYSEFEVLRSQAILAVQVGEFSDREQQQMNYVLDVLRTFRDAYRLQQNGSYEAAIEAANATSTTSDRLRGTDRGEQYALLVDVALERFYGKTGQALQNRAEQQSSTPRRLDTLQQAALSYRRSGSPDRTAQVLLRVDSTQTTYRADVDAMNASATTTTQFIDNCGDCSAAAEAITTYGLGVFPRYRQSLAASQEIRGAVDLADKHGLADRSESLSQAQTTVESSQSTLALASASVIVAYVTLLGLAAAVVSRQLLSWYRDLHAATRGDSVLLGAMLDA